MLIQAGLGSTQVVVENARRALNRGCRVDSGGAWNANRQRQSLNSVAGSADDLLSTTMAKPAATFAIEARRKRNAAWSESLLSRFRCRLDLLDEQSAQQVSGQTRPT